MIQWSTACPEKVCSRCKVPKPATVEYFHANKGGKYGLRGQCRPCHQFVIREQIKQPHRAEKRKQIAIAYVRSGKNAEAKRAWRAVNLEKSRAATASWKKRNPEQSKESDQRWRKANPEKVRAKQRRADAKVQKNPVHVLNKRVKARIRGALRGQYEVGTIGKYLDFSKQELRLHIERQFTEGMTWDRLMTGEIHIDHILPVSSFNIRQIGDEEFKACWSLGNLRPLWNVDNWRKQAKVLTLI